MKTKRIFLASCLLASCLLAACLQLGCASIHTAGGQPGRKPTAMEQVMVWNAGIADSNLAIAKGVIAATEAAEIDVATANAILTEQSRIADADRQLTPILAKACTPQQLIQACNPSILSGDAATIKGFLDQIAASGKNLVGTGTAGIKNPQRAKAVGDAIAAIGTLAGEMTAGLQSLGVIR